MSAETGRRRGPQPRGDRVGVTMRIPGDQAEIYRDRAEQLGIPLSSWIALALAEHENLDIPSYVRDEIKKSKIKRAVQAMEQELEMPRSA